MKTMTETGLRKIAQRFIDNLDHATYELDGVEKNIDILKRTIDGAEVKVYVYFDDTVVGNVANVKLVDKDGDVVAVSTRSFTKPSRKGLYETFKYSYVEREV